MLHGVLDPEVHVNGIEKKKKKDLEFVVAPDMKSAAVGTVC